MRLSSGDSQTEPEESSETSDAPINVWAPNYSAQFGIANPDNEASAFLSVKGEAFKRDDFNISESF